MKLFGNCWPISSGASAFSLSIGCAKPNGINQIDHMVFSLYSAVLFAFGFRGNCLGSRCGCACGFGLMCGRVLQRALYTMIEPKLQKQLPEEKTNKKKQKQNGIESKSHARTWPGKNAINCVVYLLNLALFDAPSLRAFHWSRWKHNENERQSA